MAVCSLTFEVSKNQYLEYCQAQASPDEGKASGRINQRAANQMQAKDSESSGAEQMARNVQNGAASPKHGWDLSSHLLHLRLGRQDQWKQNMLPKQAEKIRCCMVSLSHHLPPPEEEKKNLSAGDVCVCFSKEVRICHAWIV